MNIDKRYQAIQSLAIGYEELQDEDFDISQFFPVVVSSDQRSNRYDESLI